jgi:hypothetical protein
MADGDVTSGGGDAAGTDAELICGLQEALAVEQAKNRCCYVHGAVELPARRRARGGCL